MTGRPSDYTPELAALICGRVAEGETLMEISRDDAMPARGTVYRWLAQHEAFRDEFARARVALAEVYADDIAEIADDATNDWMDRRRADGGTDRVVDHEHVSRSKLRIETRRWLMGKWSPKRYGDRTEVSGPGGGPIQTEDVTPLERARLIAFALEKGARAAGSSKTED